MDNELFGSPVIAILRGYTSSEALARAQLAWDLGIDLVEVPVQSDRDTETLRAVVAAGDARGMPVGVGTVVSRELVRLARDEGAAFTVAPGLDVAVAEESQRYGLPHLPGVASATDIQRARAIGLNAVKVFPAISLGESWFRVMSGPFPDVRFFAVGGIDARNARAFLSAGADGVGVGSALDDPRQIEQLAAIARA